MKRVLLVEDDPTFAGYLNKRLSLAGYRVEWASDGLRVCIPGATPRRTQVSRMASIAPIILG